MPTNDAVTSGIGNKPKWEIYDGSRRLAWGVDPASMPSPQERKMFQAHGYQVVIDGKKLAAKQKDHN